MSDKLSVNIIGSGNVATHMARRLREQGMRIAGVYSRTAAHVARLAGELGDVTSCAAIEELPAADVYIFSVKDSALSTLVGELRRHVGDTDALVVHTAGSMPIETLTSDFRNAAVVYPMQTLSRTKSVDFSTVPVFVEASNDAALRQSLHLAGLLSDHVQQLGSDGRRILHLAAVFACNFANHCYSIAFQQLEVSGIDPKVLLPLIDETAEKVHHMHPVHAQTGPAVRWDENVMNRQRELLAACPEWAQIYEAMSRSIHDTATSDT